jgi:hypothetical protein
MTLLLLAAAGLCAAADSPSLAGKWQVHTSIGGNDYEMVCTFAQNGDTLTGTCVSDQGKFEASGTVNGKKVTWSYKTEYGGTPLTVKYDGAAEAGTIKGSVDVPEFGAGGDFTATQSK